MIARQGNTGDRGALVLMALIVLIWGAGWVIMKFLSPYVGAFDVVVIRYAIGFVSLLVIQLAWGRRFRLPPILLTLAIAVFQTTAFQCLVQFALIAGGAGGVVMMAYTLPFWVALFAWLFMGDRPTRNHGVGFVLAAVGLLAVIRPWELHGALVSMLLALAGGASWGLGTVFSKMLFIRHPNADVLNLTTWQMLLGTLMAWPFTRLVPQPDIAWNAGVVFGLVYLGVMSSAVAWILWLAVVRRVNATVAGMSGLGVPVLTVLLAWALLGERPTLLELSGITLMMAGLVVVNLAGIRKPPRPGAT